MWKKFWRGLTDDICRSHSRFPLGGNTTANIINYQNTQFLHCTALHHENPYRFSACCISQTWSTVVNYWTNEEEEDYNDDDYNDNEEDVDWICW